MNLKAEKNRWNKLGEKDPYWVVLTEKGKKDGRWNKSEFYKTGLVEIEAILGYLKEKKYGLRFGKALDFGCGLGRLTQAMASQFERVIGVDISPSMIAEAKNNNRFKGKCEYYVNDSPTLSFSKNDEFDFIYSAITLQHIPPRITKRYLGEFIRVLKPGGLLVFQLPSRPSDLHSAASKARYLIKSRLPIRMQDLLMRWRYRDWAGMHMYGISRDKVSEIIGKNGGRFVDIHEDNKAGKYWESYTYTVTK